MSRSSFPLPLRTPLSGTAGAALALATGCLASPGEPTDPGGRSSGISTATTSVAAAADSPRMCFEGTPTAVPDTFATLQEAIDGSPDGAVVCVAPGTYLETIDFHGKAIRLEAAARRPRMAILDAGGSGPAVTFATGEGPDSVLAGFTVTGGNADDGGGIFIAGASPTLIDLKVRGNRADDDGGGVYAEDASPTFTRVSIVDNECGGSGGGLCMLRSTATLERVRIAVNAAGDYAGGGMFLYDSTVTGERVIFLGNSVVGTGGTAGGGAVFLNGSDLSLRSTVMAGNTSDGRGGALTFENAGQVALTNATIAGNRALNGGGMFLRDGGSDLRLENAIVAFNEASDDVGGIWNYGRADAEVAYTDVYGNSGTDLAEVAFVAGVDGNLSTNPRFAAFAGDDWRDWDLHLAETSPLVDAGDPALEDDDGTRSDMGAYGGPDSL